MLLPDRPAWKSWRVTLDFILDHPRRVCLLELFLWLHCLMNPGLHEPLSRSTHMVFAWYHNYSEWNRLGCV